MTRAAVWSLLGALAGVAVAGCGDVQSTGSGVALLPEAARQAMLTTSHFVPVAGKRDGRLSYMAPGAKRKSALMYVGDWATNDVFVYDYRSGSSVGTLRGFDAPYGMCVDKKGDVYIANFYGGTSSSTRTAEQAPPQNLHVGWRADRLQRRRERRPCRDELQSR